MMGAGITPGQHCEADRVSLRESQESFGVFLRTYSTFPFRGLACHLPALSPTLCSTRCCTQSTTSHNFSDPWAASKSAPGLLAPGFLCIPEWKWQGNNDNLYRPITNDRQELIITWINTRFSLDLPAG